MNPAMMPIARYAVVGNPVAHSRSPAIHAAFAQQTDQALSYERVLIGLGDFDHALLALAEQGFAGINVTVPFKTQAYDYFAAHGLSLTPRARLAGAANTLSFDPSGWRADNTDGLGLVSDLRDRQRISIRGAQVLVLGAGGAAQGVLGALLDVGVERLVLSNRTDSKAQALADRFQIQAVAWDALDQPMVFDVIINATSAGLQHSGALHVPPGLLQAMGKAQLCYDMVYGAQPSAWLQQASKAGCTRCVDGLGMLVDQAAHAFAFWRGILPEPNPVFAQLRQHLTLG